jgi:2-keto-4-pentenoate hydratase/2-oxohepta-3-ene-1,7-dioic acid hydratase in catechol pathway
MRLATFRHDARRHVGLVSPDGTEVQALDMDGTEGVAALAWLAAEGRPIPGVIGAVMKLNDVILEAPIPRPARNIFCVGKNYLEHAHEFARSGFDSSAAAGAVPDAPIVFSKVPECVVGHGAPIVLDDAVSSAVDYEAELAVIIGRPGRGIARAQAMAHVFGYTIINDVTARDLQGRHKQWLIGKSQDTFGPMGPFAVTVDGMNLADTQLRLWVNGELRQDANTRDLMFDVPTLIETISAGITLIPGDIIATGTPVGVGIGFTPPRYLRPGDTVRIGIPPIGVLENPVVAR